MQRKKKIILGAVISMVFILAFVTFILPSIVKNKASEAIERATGRKVHIGSLAINPFTLTVTADDFAIQEQGRPPLLSLGQLRASLSPASVFRRALILSEVSLERPSISFARTAPNRYSFSDIIDRQQKDPKKTAEGGKLLYSINNISIRNGALEFDDAAAREARKHTVKNLQVGIPFISNVPYLADTYVAPKLEAVVDGAPFHFRGKLKPLSKSLETSIHLAFERLSLPQFMAYAPGAPPVTLKSGFFTLNADLSYRISPDKKPELALSGTFRLDDTTVDLKDGRPLLKLPVFQAKASKLEFFAKRFALDSLLLEAPEIYASRDQRGDWMYQGILPPPTSKESAKAQEKEDGQKTQQLPWVQVSSLVLKDGTLHLSDSLPKEKFTGTVSKINVALENLSTAANSSARYQLAMLLDGATSLESSGNFSLTPATLSGGAALKELQIRRTWPYLAPYLAQPLEGKLDLAAKLAFSKETGLAISDGNLAVSGLATRYGKGEGLKLARLAVQQASFDQKENSLKIEEIGLHDGSFSLSREADGSLSVMSMLKKPSTQVNPAAAPARSASQRPAPVIRTGIPPFSYRIGKVNLAGLDCVFTDRTREENPAFTLRKTRLSLANVNGPKFTPIALRFSSVFAKNAPIAASGQMFPSPFRYNGTVSLGRLPITEFDPYLPENLNVIVVSGLLDADLKLDLSLQNGKPVGTFKGNAGVRAFHTMDAIDENDLLKWESLQFDTVDGNLSPFRLGIREVSLNNAYARVIVNKNGALNLQNLVEKPEPVVAKGSGASSAEKLEPTPAIAATQGTSPAAASEKQKQISIGSLTVQGGTLAFSDLHLPNPFNTTFYNLGGRVSGLSSEETKFADVDLRGNLENHSPLQIVGRINPLREDLLVDLKVSFRDIELPIATPYSSTYLGYNIDQGKLFLDLKYLIEKKQISSSNKVFIDQFTFGGKTESKQATALPVRLAVGLLKDRKGEIHLDLPVTGKTDDPKFSIGKVVWQMLRNLVVKAATAPFSLLSSMFGGDQDLSSVSFASGSSRLSPAESAKLRNLAKVLADRPGIRLEVTAFVDQESDPEGYRKELLQKKMKSEKFLQLVKKERDKAAGQSAESQEILPEERAALLKAVYEKEKFPKPRTVLGTLKDLPVEEMEKLIITHTIVGAEQLRGLAHERGLAVTAFLAGEANLPRERIFEKAGDIYAASKKGGAGGRVEFGVTVP